MNNKFSRRAVVASLAALTLPLPAFALSGSAAESLVNAAVADINKIIASGKSERAMQSDFQRVFERYADVNIIALTTLGPARRSASKAEVSAFVKAFKGYFTRKYGKRFREFTNAEISITKSKDLGKKGVIVETLIRTSVYAPFPVEWWVIDDGRKRSFFDIIIEGVRLQSAERGEIRALLDRSGGSVSKLAATLNQLG